MVRRQERLIATLLVWIATLFALLAVLERFTRPILDIQNNWYYVSSVVTSQNPEEANQAINSIQEISNNIYFQTQQFANSELLTYSPAVLVVGAALLIAATLSTMFIWRSVIVPNMETASDSAALGKIKARGSRLRELPLGDENEDISDLEPSASRNGK